TPRDRRSNFEPQLVKKRETIVAESLEKKILGMYGLGMSLRGISNHIKKMYDTDISHSTLSSITDKIIPEVKEWQSRSLDALYTIVWMDAMHYKCFSRHRSERSKACLQGRHIGSCRAPDGRTSG